MLENRKVVFVKSNGEKVNGKVLLCEPGVGIAIVSEHDETRYLLCVSGPLSPIWGRTKRDDNDYEVWEKAWHFVTSRVIDGVDLDMKDLDRVIGAVVKGGASSDSCPFGG